MAKKKVVKTAPVVDQFIDLANTQRNLADSVANKFLEFCNRYLNEECVVVRSELTSMSIFSPSYLILEVCTKKPTSDSSRLNAYIGNISFELTYDALGEEYDDEHFKDELLKFLNK